MLKFLIFAVIIASSTAWDPSLKIAEKIAIPHHIRHGYDYPYINIAQMVNRQVRQGFSQQPSPFEVARPQSQGFRQLSPVQPQGGFQPSQPFVEPNRGFQSQPFDQGRGFRSSPIRQTRFFDRFSGNPRPDFGISRSGPAVGASRPVSSAGPGRSTSFFNRRLS